MSKKAARIGVTSLVLVMAFAGLLYSTMGESLEYYKKVDEVMANPQEWQGKALQIHGYAKDVGRKRDSLDWQFDIHNNGKVVRAYYTGVTPDTFKNDSEVVVKGRLSENNTFHATEIIAKCPSKVQSGGRAHNRHTSKGAHAMASLGYFLLLAAFVVCAYAAAMSVAGARRRSSRLIESGVGASYLMTAIMAVASSVIVYSFVVGDYSIKYVQRYSDSALPLYYKIPSVLGWARRLDHVLGDAPVGVRQRRRLREQGTAPGAHPVCGGGHRRRTDVLSVPDDHPQQSLRDVPDRESGGRDGPESAPPELLHGDPPAHHVSRIRRA